MSKQRWNDTFLLSCSDFTADLEHAQIFSAKISQVKISQISANQYTWSYNIEASRWFTVWERMDVIAVNFGQIWYKTNLIQSSSVSIVDFE